MLGRAGGREMPFDIGCAGDQGDVVQVDDLGQRNQFSLVGPVISLPSYLQMKLELWLWTYSARSKHWKAGQRGL